MTRIFRLGPKELFQKSANRKNYTESELIQNLKQILELNQSEDSGHETRANTCLIVLPPIIQDQIGILATYFFVVQLFFFHAVPVFLLQQIV
jgi:adenylyl- and sulfurtransferase ThiI